MKILIKTALLLALSVCSEAKSSWWDKAKNLVGYAAIGAGAVAAAPMVVGAAAGVTAAGPAAGGAFAAAQAAGGAIQAGGMMAGVQSFVMGGVATSSVVAGGAVGALACKVKKCDE